MLDKYGEAAVKVGGGLCNVTMTQSGLISDVMNHFLELLGDTQTRTKHIHGTYDSLFKDENFRTNCDYLEVGGCV